MTYQVQCANVHIYVHKGPFIATQLNSTQLDRRRQLSCVGEGVYSDATQLNVEFS